MEEKCVEVQQQVGSEPICDKRCAECDAEGSCLACDDGYYKQVDAESELALCVRQCSAGFYVAANGNECEKCEVANCDSCHSNGQCSQCMEGFVLSNNGKCLDQCPKNQYPELDASNGEGYLCKNCGTKCSDCDSKLTCNTCMSPANKIVSVKPALSNAQIQEALSNGFPCRGSLECPEGDTFFNNQDKTC